MIPVCRRWPSSLINFRAPLRNSDERTLQFFSTSNHAGALTDLKEVMADEDVPTGPPGQKRPEPGVPEVGWSPLGGVASLCVWRGVWATPQPGSDSPAGTWVMRFPLGDACRVPRSSGARAARGHGRRRNPRPGGAAVDQRFRCPWAAGTSQVRGRAGAREPRGLTSALGGLCARSLQSQCQAGRTWLLKPILWLGSSPGGGSRTWRGPQGQDVLPSGSLHLPSMAVPVSVLWARLAANPCVPPLCPPLDTVPADT